MKMTRLKIALRKWSSVVIVSYLLVPSLLGASERFPLGILGAHGEVEPGSSLITIVSIQKGSPADQAALQLNDRISGIAGTPFNPHTKKVDDGGSGPQKSLGEFLDLTASKTSSDDRKFQLDIFRGEEEKNLALQITCQLPMRPRVLESEGKKQLQTQAANQLGKTISPKGYWDSPVGLTGDRVLTAWATVALIASGRQQDLAVAEIAHRWLTGPQQQSWIPDNPLEKGPDNLGNWAITSTVIALVEYCGGNPDKDLQTVLERNCNALKSRMDPTGLFGHDVVPGYNKKGFNVINTLSHLAWAMGQKAKIPIDNKIWDLSIEQIRRSIDPNGGVRYWTLKNTGTGDASLRTSSMALALGLKKSDEKMLDRLSSYLDQYNSRTREAHAVGSLGMILAPAALWRHDKEAYQRFVSEWRWYLALMQDHKGEIHYIGGKGNNGGDSYLGKNRIACIIALMILSPPDEKLILFKK